MENGRPVHPRYRALLPLLGLVLKVHQTPEGEEKLVNFVFADPDLIRSLALVLSPAEGKANNTPKE